MTAVNNCTIVVGGKGTGKSTYIKEKILLPSPLPKKLILDTFDSPIWRNLESHNHPENKNIPIPVIAHDKIKYWKSGIYRAYSSNPSELMDVVAKDLYNCLLIVEDATRFVSTTRCPKNIMEFIYDSKQKNLNVTLAFHSLKSIPTNLLDVVDYVCLGKTNDQKLPSKFPDHFLPVFEHLKKSKDPYERITLSFEG